MTLSVLMGVVVRTALLRVRPCRYCAFLSYLLLYSFKFALCLMISWRTYLTYVHFYFCPPQPQPMLTVCYRFEVVVTTVSQKLSPTTAQEVDCSNETLKTVTFWWNLVYANPKICRFCLVGRRLPQAVGEMLGARPSLAEFVGACEGYNRCVSFRVSPLSNSSTRKSVLRPTVGPYNPSRIYLHRPGRYMRIESRPCQYFCIRQIVRTIGQLLSDLNLMRK